MTSAAVPIEAVMGPRRRPWRRLPLYLVAFSVILLVATWTWPAPDLERFKRSAASWGIVFLDLLLLVVWVLGLSTWRWRVRLAVLLIPVALLFATVRRVDFDGDMVPIAIHFRWEKTAAETREAFHATQGTAAADDLTQVRASDFPAYRGSNRDGVVVGPPLERDWANRPPRHVWDQPCGEGLSGFAVVASSLLTQEQIDQDEAVVCYDAATGRQRWAYRYPTLYSEPQGGPGPRATPAVADGDVFALGATGRLVCVDGRDGRLKWQAETLANNANITWGTSTSPLIVDDLVVVNPGAQVPTAHGRALLAYDRRTGREVWAAGSHKGSYSSPNLVTLAGQRQILIYDAGGLAGCDPASGREFWRFPWANSQDANVAQPLVLPDDRVFITSGYGSGCAVVHITKTGDSWSVRPVWQNEKMRCRFSSPVYHEGHLYGLDEGILVCLDASDGRRLWKEERYGNGQLLLCNGLLVILAESGNLVLVEASPDACRELGRIRVLPGDRTWNCHALADGKAYVRHHFHMACFDLAARP